MINRNWRVTMTEKKSDGKKQIAMIKKLSTPKIMGGRLRFKEGESQRDLYQIVGVASGSKSGTSDYGEWRNLTGNFAAINLVTGEEFRSGIAFLPDVALDPILGQLSMGATAVEFGFTISIIEDDDSATGYVYTAMPLIEPDENDPLEALTGKFTRTDNLLTDESGDKEKKDEEKVDEEKPKPKPKPKAKPPSK